MSGMDAFPALTNGNRLEHLDSTTAAAYSQKLATFITAVLIQHGPLPPEGVRYFLNLRHDLRIGQQDINEVLFSYTDSFCRLGRVYRTPEQEKMGTMPTSPPPDNYAESYYELLTLLNLIREHPELARTPTNMLMDLLHMDRLTHRRPLS